LSFEDKALKVIPVIDILNGVVVHAVRGNRQEYKPLQSVLTASVDPVEVATVFKLQGFSTLYLADLDAIQGKKPCIELYSCIAKIGFNLIVDAGATDIETVKNLLKCGVSKVIVGTETLHSRVFLQETVRQVGADKIIVSLDIKNDALLTHPIFNDQTDMFELIEEFRAMGVAEFILLDLTRVGSSEGINAEVLKNALITTLNDSCVYVGGGIRNIDDLLTLKKQNILGALSATALHLGKISLKDLKNADLL
jgi:phosphoribosylformimino-5-aminoimidazole carboxamide ribotide isomerase